MSDIRRRGLKLGDQDEQNVNAQMWGTTGFDANRQKSNTQKQMDSLLFGNIKPAPSRRGQGANGPPPAQVKKIQGKTSPVKPSPKPSPVKPSPAKDPIKQIITPVVIKQFQPQQPKNIKNIDSVQSGNNIDNLNMFNKPAYIRKLKKVAQDFKFHEINSNLHKYIQVLKPSQTLKSITKKGNSPGFIDSQFPPNNSSISLIKEQQPSDCVWKKPRQILKNPVFGKYIDPNDIKPGTYSSPQFLSTLSVLAQRQQNIKRLIENQKINSNGFYYVRINVNGVWRYVLVDDNLPQSTNGISCQSYNDNQAQLWVSILQKAYAKVYNGYDVFKNNTIPRQHYLRDLTGAPVKRYQVNDSQINKIITQALSKGYPILAVPSQNITQLGFNPNYSLSVTKASNKGIEFRSSFGTIVQRPKVNISKQGTFELNSSQLNSISHILIAEVDNNTYSTTIQSKHCSSFYSCYSFKIGSHQPNATITVSQFDKRLFSKKSQYNYTSFRVIIQKKQVEQQQSNSLYINAGFSYKSRNLDLSVNLSPGTYYIYCIGQWQNQNNYDYNLTLFATQNVHFNRIYHSNFPNIIAQALTSITLENGKRNAKGSVQQYILYHQPSNLVLITALSLVDRNYNHTLNMQQIKGSELSLLNAVRPEDKFSLKTKEQNSKYKSSVFNQKNWQVSLLPREKYTWVFSSNSDYDPSNFKNWGFR